MCYILHRETTQRNSRFIKYQTVSFCSIQILPLPICFEIVIPGTSIPGTRRRKMITENYFKNVWSQMLISKDVVVVVVVVVAFIVVVVHAEDVVCLVMRCGLWLDWTRTVDHWCRMGLLCQMC